MDDSYARFALQVGLPLVLPIHPRSLYLYVASAAHRLRPATLRTYLSALVFFHTLAGLDASPFRAPRLRLLLRGADRARITPATRPPRFPLSP